MKFLSVCSGIEAASVAWRPLGWEAVAVAEIEKFPSAVLAHHYPAVPNLGDITKFREWDIGPIDVLVGGTPCQPFSVAGLRKGMADPRGNLALVFLALADRFRPRWVVWENVPGVRSSWSGAPEDEAVPPEGWEGDETSDLDCFIAGLRELGYMGCLRSFDAQYFGLAQRRERVFVVAHLGDWRGAVAVLLEPEGLSGNPPPRREAGEEVAGTIGGGSGERGWPNSLDNATFLPVAYGGNRMSGPVDMATAVNAHGGPHGRLDIESETFVAMPLLAKHNSSHDDSKETYIAHALRADGFDASEDGTGRGTPVIPIDMRQASRGGKMTNNRQPGKSGGAPGTGVGAVGDPAPSLATGHVPAIAFSCEDHGADAGDKAHVLTDMAVRRLTPRECERLQGFPDDYTLIKYNGKPAADGPRYKALGNSMAVPVMAWIGRRLQMADDVMRRNA